MIRTASRFVVASLLIVCVAGCAPSLLSGLEPTGLLLSWHDDPTSTMTIDWHTTPDADGAGAMLSYRRVDAWPGVWRTVQAKSFPFPFSERTVHRAHLVGLRSDSAYEFRLPVGSRTFRFRTMPTTLDGPLRFAAGGDVRHRQSWMEQMNRVVMEHEPQFIVWGGDLAYADGREDRVERWYEFFDAIMNTFITDDGRVVPVIVGIGNHEVPEHLYFRADDYEPTDAWRAGWAPYFFTLFAFPGQPGYNALDFGDYLSLIVLDTAHANPIEGEQSDWLRRALEVRRGRYSHIIPIQHIPAWPSVRSPDGHDRSWGGLSRLIRENWSPLFEQAGVRVVFENHDHAYKRTPPIRGDAPHEEGIVFIGDGAWGVNVREVHDADETWYLERAESVRHGLIVTIDGDTVHVRAVSAEGKVIDESTIGSVATTAE